MKVELILKLLMGLKEKFLTKNLNGQYQIKKLFLIDLMLEILFLLKKKKIWDLKQYPKVNGGIVVIDPYTGDVKALVGGFNFKSSEFNRVTQAKRQPGSAFKPIVYAAALENGYSPIQ